MENDKNRANETLMLAASSGNLELIKDALALGADPNAFAKGCALNPLMEAARLGREDICAVLLTAGGDATKTDGEGWSALHYAIVSASSNEGWREVLPMLMQAGARLTNTREGETPLMMAAKSFEVTKYLLSHNAVVGVADASGHTALMRAVRAKAGIQHLELLISKGESPETKNLIGWDAERHAIEAGYRDGEDFLRALREAKALESEGGAGAKSQRRRM